MAEIYDGVIYGDYSKYTRLRINYTVSQNETTAVSTITMNLYAERTKGSEQYNNSGQAYWNLTGKGNTSMKFSWAASSLEMHLGSSSTTVQHNPDGTGSVTLSGYWYTGRTGSSYIPEAISISKNITLKTIPRASSVSGGSGNIAGTTTISVSRASTSFTHTLRYVFGSLSGTIATGVGTSYNWTIPTSFYSCIPNERSSWGTIYCDTYNGGQYIGTKETTFTATVTEESSRPIVGGHIIDINENTRNLTGNQWLFVKHASTAELSIFSEVRNYASIRSVTVNGINVGNSTPLVLTYYNVTTPSFEIVTTDSRGFSNTYFAINPNYIDYIPLTTSAKFFRPQPTGSEIQLTYSGNYYNGGFGQVNNELLMTWDYKEKTSSEWLFGGWITPYIDGNTITQQTISLGTNFDYQKDYNFRMVAWDKVNSTTIYQDVSVGMPVFYWGKDFMIVNGRFKANTYFLGVKNPACWAYIGEIELGSQGSYAVLDCYMGDGQNGRAEQNTHARILLKQGWTGDTLPIGITTRYTQNYKSSIKVKISHTSSTKCKLYMYLPFLYNDLTYTINGSYNSFTPSNTILSEEPTTDKESTYYKDFEPVSLYDNSSGTNGTVTLSQSAANFAYLEIFYRDSDKHYNSVKIASPNGKEAWLSGGYIESNASGNVKYKNVTVSGTSITSKNYIQVAFNGGDIVINNYIYITKVVGYK